MELYYDMMVTAQTQCYKSAQNTAFKQRRIYIMPKEALICSKCDIEQTEMASHVGQMFSISVYNQRRFHSPVRFHYII